MKNIKEYASEKISKMSDNEAVTALFMINAGINIGLVLLAGLLSRADNNLTKEKKFIAQNPITPMSSEVCTNNIFDSGCYRKAEIELCDGQNTILNFGDDVCENISYWNYIPTLAETIK